MKATGCVAAAIPDEQRAAPEAGHYVTVRDVARRSSMSEKSVRNIIRTISDHS